MFKSFRQACQFLSRFTDYERMEKFHYGQTAFNLKRMRKLLRLVGEPHKELHFVHIAGTKGKGSTAIILESILRAADCKVGLFTSPHLISIQERIQVNGRPISRKSFTSVMNQLYPFITRRVRTTFFEIITAVALLYFLRQRVDLVIMEVGLGGRLDATNVITPLVSAITRIDFDHTDKLGRTLPKIAREKAGIIKPGVPVVCARNPAPVIRVIRETGQREKTPFVLVGKDIRIDRVKSHTRKNKPEITFDIRTRKQYYRGLRLPLAGVHQAENAAIAVGISEFIDSWEDISPSVVREGLKRVYLPGRIEVISRRPLIIVDGAHNPLSVQTLRGTIRENFRYKRLILILSISRDKEIGGMLKLLLPLVDMVIFTRANNPRMCEPVEFIRWLRDYNVTIPVFMERSVKKAFLLARTLAKRNDLILVTGSFYLAGEIKALKRRYGDGFVY